MVAAHAARIPASRARTTHDRGGDGVRRAFITDPDDHIVESMETGVEVTGDEPPLYGPGHNT